MVMEIRNVLFRLLPALSFFTLVNAKGCNTVFPGIPTFGEDCKFKCHCYDYGKCSESSGCENERCGHGWMGPHCQYRNAAKDFKETAQEGENFIQHSDLAVDGNLQTCSETNLAQSDGQQAWRIQLDRNYLVVGVRIHILENDRDNFEYFRIETGPTSLSFPNLCYENQNKPTTSVIEVMCVVPTETQNIRITQLSVNVPLRICEFEIYGGREIAFNVPAYQSTTHGTWSSYHAVDGRNPDKDDELVIEQNACARTNGSENNPFLSIDLQQVFKITGMSVYGRYSSPGQTQGIRIDVGESAETANEVFHDNTQGTPDPEDYSPLNIQLDLSYIARVVKVSKRPYSGTATLSVCEMHVYAECIENKCGWDCEKECHCKGEITGTMKIDGKCPFGCSGRWNGIDGACDIECSVKEWGELCQHSCGNCSSFPCDLNTGQCSGGCSGPWIPPLCTQSCGKGTFGQNCLKQCGHCQTGTTCDSLTGICPQGCDPGWQGDRCDTECPDQRFGKDCRQRCYCYDGVNCNKISGQCPGDCSPGYTGIHCNSVCPNGHYGLTCAHTCGKCRNGGACNHINGRCSDGCKPGYEGALCNHGYNLIERTKDTVVTKMSSVSADWDGKRAIDGDIGPDPTSCQCCSSTNNEAVSWLRITLPKISPMLSAEVYPSINEKIVQQLQGFSLTVKNQTNEKGILVATNEKIEDADKIIIDIPNIPARIIEIRRVGKLTICEVMVREGECPVGRYGDECKLFCRCADRKPCDRATGLCATPVCEIGWTGKACSKECSGGFYGQHCALRCNNCKGNKCHPDTGICKDGCMDGYEGYLCTEVCKSGFYGKDCSNDCGKCKDSEACDYKTGACKNGCEHGYSTPTCNRRETSGTSVMSCSWATLLLLFVALLY